MLKAFNWMLSITKTNSLIVLLDVVNRKYMRSFLSKIAFIHDVLPFNTILRGLNGSQLMHMRDFNVFLRIALYLNKF